MKKKRKTWCAVAKGNLRIGQGRVPSGHESAKRYRSGNRKTQWKSKTRKVKQNKPAPARALSLNDVGGTDVYLKPHPLRPGRYLGKGPGAGRASCFLKRRG